MVPMSCIGHHFIYYFIPGQFEFIYSSFLAIILFTISVSSFRKSKSKTKKDKNIGA